MPFANAYNELISSQLPALHLLTGLGWQYLTPVEANTLRGNKKSTVILDQVLADWLRTHNRINYKGHSLEFSEANISEALRKLKAVPLAKGLLPASSEVYELLTLGESFEQAIGGDKRSFQMTYIDWLHPENNVYHVTDEFSVERQGDYRTCRPDIVLFVNGIPLAVIECKRPDLEATEGKPVEQAVTQMIRNQQRDQIPLLFAYTQLLLAVTPHEALYATTGTSREFWARWREEMPLDVLNGQLVPLINHPLEGDEQAHLYDHRDEAYQLRQHFGHLGERLPTEQDRTLYSLLNPMRLLELAYQFIVYDDGRKKLARYQQYFAIRATMDRVVGLNAQGTRTGGIIWHTTGSGKSLTMVMLAKALTLHPAIKSPRVVLVTDRIDLDDQIWRTFKACGKQVVKAQSGRNLVDLVRSGNADIITTVIDKFERVSLESVTDQSANIFVLVDESHRSQYGLTHDQMKKVFPNACYIGFTGTPLLKKEKVTNERFGGFIHKYTMRQAVEDRAVARLLYDGRDVDLDIDRAELDTWFERRTRDLTDAQKFDLKRKMSRFEEVNRINPRLQTIAYDLAEHYIKNHRGTGFKGQFATASRESAVQYFRLLHNEEKIKCAVIMSPPDTREGSDDIDDSAIPEVQAFWKRMMDRYGDEKTYDREIKKSFSEPDGIEILIVVDRLLVGFDEPRNTVLYIDKPLREHGLLQAIARVNRLCEGKDFGYIVDYRGVLGELNEAMQTYNALENFDAEDVAGTVTDVSAVIDTLPHLHSQLWDVFKTVPNRNDTEAMEQFLEPEDRRHQFYEALSAFAGALKVALSVVRFYEDNPKERIATYKQDLTYFHKLRTAVKLRYAETIDYGDYEQKIRKVMNDHIGAPGITTIIRQLDIFNAEQFDQAVLRLATPAARGDTIAYHARRTITDKMAADPAFYRKLSQLIDETIQKYREGRLSELEYLHEMTEHKEQLRAGQDSGLPSRLKQFKDAAAYYGVIEETFKRYTPSETSNFADTVAEIAIVIEQKIEPLKIRDWVDNPDIESTMRTVLDDVLYDVKYELEIPLTSADMDLIVDNVLEVARKRESLA